MIYHRLSQIKRRTSIYIFPPVAFLMCPVSLAAMTASSLSSRRPGKFLLTITIWLSQLQSTRNYMRNESKQNCSNLLLQGGAQPVLDSWRENGKFMADSINLSRSNFIEVWKLHLPRIERIFFCAWILPQRCWHSSMSVRSFLGAGVSTTSLQGSPVR